MSEPVEIHGLCQPAFAPVRAAFESNFAEGLEKGASVAVTHQGELVLDLWGGWADEAETRPWEKDTLVILASTTKIMTILCALMLIDRGVLDPDARVADYWPEFAQKGKDEVLVRHLFNHSAGVPGWSPPIPFSTLYDWERTVASLAEQELWWVPGTQSGYHGETFGFLVGELIRRVSGLTPGVFLQKEVTSKIGAEFYIGTPADALSRFARPVVAEERDWGDPESVPYRAMNCFLPPAWEDVECLLVEIPGGNGVGNARSVAQIGAILANNGSLAGHRFLSPGTIELALTEQSYRHDLVIDMPVRYGFGLGLNSAEFGCPSERSLHWGGAGGSFCIMDVESGTCIAYAMNRWLARMNDDPRNAVLREAYLSVVGTL